MWRKCKKDSTKMQQQARLSWSWHAPREGVGARCSPYIENVSIAMKMGELDRPSSGTASVHAVLRALRLAQKGNVGRGPRGGVRRSGSPDWHRRHPGAT